jgi:hypothetical protein
MPFDVDQLRQLYTLECTFLAQYFDELQVFRSGVRVAVQIDDIVEIAWPGTLGYSPHLLRRTKAVCLGLLICCQFRRLRKFSNYQIRLDQFRIS